MFEVKHFNANIIILFEVLVILFGLKHCFAKERCFRNMEQLILFNPFIEIFPFELVYLIQ